MRLKSQERRKGTHAVECAVIYPVFFFFVLAIAVGGMGVFRYIETAELARECARYAAVHAGQYQQENAAAIAAGTLPNVNDNYLQNNIVWPQAVGLDKSKLSLAVNFNWGSGSYDWDNTAANGQRYPYTLNSNTTPSHFETNTVSVTVTYKWVPEWFLTGPLTLSSTSVHAINY
jgi:Flp pilus assembly protein TadG